MRNQRQFDAPMSAMEAAQRAQYVLGKWKYKSWGIPGGVRFERGFVGSALFVVNPHHVHTTIDLKLQEVGPESCRVQIDQRIMKLGQPCSNLDKMVWQGDLEDLEGILIRREEPKIDRVKEDRYAGSISIKYLCATVLILAGAVGWLLAIGNVIGAVICVVVIIVPMLLLPHLPFRMPHFPIDNQIPAPPFESNYVRGRNQP